jgi:lantibiotic biosynthesis protein
VYSGLPDGSPGGFAGWYDLGLSHGVLGPAAALALARAAGWDTDGLAGAIEHVRAWVTDRRVEDDDGIRWPAGYLAGEDAARRASRAARPTWCYGSVGVARALWHIGRALDDADQQGFALRAARSAVEQVVRTGEPRGATLCHGTSGVLQCCLRFVADTGDERLRSFIPALAGRVLASCDPALPFIVSEERADGQWVDDPGFLAGAAGAGLALLALSTEVTPRWDRALLMS